MSIYDTGGRWLGRVVYGLGGGGVDGKEYGVGYGY